MAQTKIKRRPKNGSYFVACLVGATPTFLRTAQENVARLGVYAKYLWGQSSNLATRDIPDDIDVFVTLRDSNTSRHDRDTLMHRARSVGVWTLDPAAVHSNISTALAEAGFERPHALDLDAITNPPAEQPQLSLVPPPEEPTAPPAVEERMGKAAKPSKADLDNLTQAGNLCRRKRTELGKTLAEVGKAIGVSGSAIGMIEGGKSPPSDTLCAAVENYYKLPEGTIPRLASRKGNAKVMKVTMGAPIDEERAPLVSIPALAPLPAPIPIARVERSPYEQLFDRLIKLQGELGALGIATVFISPEQIHVTKKGS